ncbi:hypothetical protein R3P38DRAFT_3201625 [Favolaschia claudopus]|uniref:Uncharacterized protein n=1 Tax=Favolaschia claudopus TaxID=2862362 RepID=A0AAW0AVD7_9AGAR
MSDAFDIAPPPPDAAPNSGMDTIPPASPSPEPADNGPEIVTRQKTKRKRHRRGEEKAKPGKPPWVHGTKRVFFTKRRDEWLRESEAGRAGQFYTKMAKLFVRKYGCDLNDDQDLAVDVEDPPDEAANEVVHGLPAAEADRQSEYVAKIRGRIGQWYRSEYGDVSKTDKAAFKQVFAGVLDGAPVKPQRGRLIHFYSRNYYETRIKDHVEERMAALARVAELTGEEPAKQIDVVSKVTAEMWNAESPAFRHECEVAAEVDYQQKVKAWKAALPDSATRTPEEMAASLDNAAFYLQPFVDAIQDRFGMCASILLAGPIGRHGGKIGVQSVHAGVTRGLAPANWPTFDWRGFRDVETSMVAFAKEVYTQAECDARACRDEESGPSRAAPAPVAPPAAPSSVIDPPPPAAPAAPPASPSSAVDPPLPSAPAAPAAPPAAPSSAVDPPPPSGAAASPSSAPPVSPPELPVIPPGSERRDDDERVSDDERVPDDNERDAEEERRRADDVWLGREDRGEWTSELVAANRAMAEGRNWEPQWAACVRKFFDFEAAWGFVDGLGGKNGQLGRTRRPIEIGGWVNRGRKWGLPPSVGMLLGRRTSVGQGAQLWVPRWWGWWSEMQPAEREKTEDGGLTRPEAADWSALAKMYGINGLMLVMASLCWWGSSAERFGGDDKVEWLAAVSDVTWVLEQLLESGEIRRELPDEENVDDDRSEKGDEAGDKPNKRKRGAGVELEKDAEEGPRKKKSRKKEATVVPRRTTRRRGEATPSSARATRSSTSKANGKRPQPKPLQAKR